MKAACSNHISTRYNPRWVPQYEHPFRKEHAMNYYSGLDVSLKETFISIIDEDGLTVKEGFVPTDVGSISSYLKEGGLTYDKIGIESGQLSISLCKRSYSPRIVSYLR